mmetsp:Transcript_1668/g.3673  ORF Transcript_1668/g.3673 Transcript_1668/m.3673 type:complete len:392 (-) Transcript_1668:222-1397(-)
MMKWKPYWFHSDTPVQSLVLVDDLHFLPVPHRIRALPPPRVLAHLPRAQPGVPPQQLPRLLRISVQLRHVPRSPVNHLVRHRLPRGLSHSLHQLEDRDPLPRAEVDGLASHVVRVQLVQGGDVAFGQVDDMYVIPHAGPVGGVIIVPEDAQLLSSANTHLRDEGHQIVRYALWILPHSTRGMRPDRVEVSKYQNVPRLRLARVQIPQYLLDEELRPPVRVRRRQPRLLPQGQHLRLAIHGRTRRKYEVRDARGLKLPQEARRAADVDAVVIQRLRHRLPHRLEAGEVDAAGDGGEFFQDGLQPRPVPDVAVPEVQPALRVQLFVPQELFHAVQALLAGVLEVVDDHDLVPAGGEELEAGVRADVARAARNEDRAEVVVAVILGRVSSSGGE